MAPPTSDPKDEREVPPLTTLEEIKALLQRIAAIEEEFVEMTNRLHFLYGLEMTSASNAPGPVGNNDSDERDEEEKNGNDDGVGRKEKELKAKVEQKVVKQRVVKENPVKKKKPRLCKTCKRNWLEDDAPPRYVNCKTCRDKKTEVWNAGQIKREQRKQQVEHEEDGEEDDEEDEEDDEEDDEVDDSVGNEEQRKQPRKTPPKGASRKA